MEHTPAAKKENRGKEKILAGHKKSGRHRVRMKCAAAGGGGVRMGAHVR